MGSYYRETRHERGGQTTDDPEPALPRTHAELDELADERGYAWSADGLTVAEKQAELEA